MKLSWKALFIFFCIFVTGAVTGGVLTLHWFKKRPGPPTAKPTLEQYSRTQLSSTAERLGLTEEQRALLKPVFAQAYEDLRKLRKNTFKQTIELMESTNAEIEKVLTPEQKDLFDGLQVKQHERMHSLMQNTPPPRRDTEAPMRKILPIPAEPPAKKAQ